MKDGLSLQSTPYFTLLGVVILSSQLLVESCNERIIHDIIGWMIELGLKEK